MLRTTLDANQEEIQWQIYNVVREVERTFRILKTDLDLRPFCRKTDKEAIAHLHLGLLAYWLVNTVRYQLKQKGINTEWQEIVRVMNTQKLVTTTMQNEYSQTIVIRKCSEPTKEASRIYETLNYKTKNFTRKKSLVPQKEIKKNETIDAKEFSSP